MQPPYQLTVDASTGIISFSTSTETKYYCRFINQTNQLSPLLGIYDLEIYEFDFQPNSPLRGKKVRDERIKYTLCHLIEKFFIVNEKRVLIYLCDAIDGKHRGRNSLFKSWHEAELINFIDRIPITIEIEEDLQPIYGGVFIRKDFPHLDILNTELIDEAAGIISRKYNP